MNWKVKYSQMNLKGDVMKIARQVAVMREQVAGADNINDKISVIENASNASYISLGLINKIEKNLVEFKKQYEKTGE